MHAVVSDDVARAFQHKLIKDAADPGCSLCC